MGLRVCQNDCHKGRCQLEGCWARRVVPTCPASGRERQSPGAGVDQLSADLTAVLLVLRRGVAAVAALEAVAVGAVLEAVAVGAVLEAVAVEDLVARVRLAGEGDAVSVAGAAFGVVGFETLLCDDGVICTRTEGGCEARDEARPGSRSGSSMRVPTRETSGE